MEFTGKTIAVTGAASGIGAATVSYLRDRGATVIGLDRTVPHDADQCIGVDLSDPDSIDQALAKIDTPLHGLCNVAGVPPTPGAAVVLRVNFLGLRHLTERVVDQLADGSSIVNIASISGAGWKENIDTIRRLLSVESFDDVASFVAANRLRDGMDQGSAYPLSKEAVIVWSLKNATRWKHRRIRVNVVSPGPIETDILPNFVSAIGPSAATPSKEILGRPSDVAPVVAFLLSDASRWIYGQNIGVDGGMSAHHLVAQHDLGETEGSTETP